MNKDHQQFLNHENPSNYWCWHWNYSTNL